MNTIRRPSRRPASASSGSASSRGNRQHRQLISHRRADQHPRRSTPRYASMAGEADAAAVVADEATSGGNAPPRPPSRSTCLRTSKPTPMSGGNRWNPQHHGWRRRTARRSGGRARGERVSSQIASLVQNISGGARGSRWPRISRATLRCCARSTPKPPTARMPRLRPSSRWRTRRASCKSIAGFRLPAPATRRPPRRLARR